MTDPPHIHLAMDLRHPTPPPCWPAGTTFMPFDPDRHTAAAQALLVAAYRDGGGRVASFQDWWDRVVRDPEYDAAVVFLATDRTGRIVGLAQCWCSGFVKDLVVDAAWRRRGIGRALLLHACAVFRERGAAQLALKVEINNPSGAERLYRALGMANVIADRTEGG